MKKTMSKFIEATDEKGEKAFINPELAMWIKEDGLNYVINMNGEKYRVSIHNEHVQNLIEFD